MAESLASLKRRQEGGSIRISDICFRLNKEKKRKQEKKTRTKIKHSLSSKTFCAADKMKIKTGVKQKCNLTLRAKG